MSQSQKEASGEFRDASSFSHPADPASTNDDESPVNDTYPQTYPPTNNINSFRQPQPGRRHGQRNSTSRQDSDMPLSQTNIYVRGLPPEFSNDDLRDLCSKFGRILSTNVPRELESNKCRGYGFIDFDNPQSASRALSAINSEGVFEAEAAKELRGRSIDRHLEQDPTNLYIANLPRDFTESSIREMLSAHGMVISTRVLRNPDGSSRCVGFARMETKQCCDQIIAHYNGKRLDENTDPLVVKLADSARRPKHSTSSSGQSSLDQANVYSNWQGVQTGRYSTGYADQYSFSPIMQNTGFQVYDPYGQNLTNVTNMQTAVPVNVQYPIIYQSPTRQISSSIPPQAPPTPNQMVYQAQVPSMQQQNNAYYSKNQNYNTYFVPYASDYMSNQQYVQSPVAYTTANIVSAQEYIYANGSATPIYVPGQFYPSLSQLPTMQMTDLGANASTSSYSNDPADLSSNEIRRPASVEKYDIISSSSQVYPPPNVRSYASDTKLNDS